MTEFEKDIENEASKEQLQDLDTSKEAIYVSKETYQNFKALVNVLSKMQEISWNTTIKIDEDSVIAAMIQGMIENYNVAEETKD